MQEFVTKYKGTGELFYQVEKKLGFLAGGIMIDIQTSETGFADELLKNKKLPCIHLAHLNFRHVVMIVSAWELVLLH